MGSAHVPVCLAADGFMAQNGQRILLPESIRKVIPIINHMVSLGREATKRAHDGKSTYAEPTRASLLKIATVLRPLLGADLESKQRYA